MSVVAGLWVLHVLCWFAAAWLVGFDGRLVMVLAGVEAMVSVAVLALF